jgi:predicted restriction endonuclease
MPLPVQRGDSMADASSILERFDRLNIWSRGGERAPNKPLLLLYARALEPGRPK